MSKQELREEVLRESLGLMLRDFSSEEIRDELKRVEDLMDLESKHFDILYDYQKEVVDYKRNNLICNWSRNLGSTFTVVNTILKNKPENVVYSGHGRNLIVLWEKFNEVFKDCENSNITIKNISTNNKYTDIKINWITGATTQIRTYSNGLKIAKGLREEFIHDYVFFDGKLPYATDIKTHKTFSFVNINCENMDLRKIYPQCHISSHGYNTGIKYGLYTDRLFDNYKGNEDKFKSEIDILNEYSEFVNEDGISIQNIHLNIKFDMKGFADEHEVLEKYLNENKIDIYNTELNKDGITFVTSNGSYTTLFKGYIKRR